jgi:hypothetical protein
VDRTGVGVAVFDMLRKARPACRLVPVTITGGTATTCQEDGCWHVPKRELAGVLGVLIGGHRLKVAPGLPLGKTLNQELAAFKVKVNIATGSESFEAWREKDHDDLVLAAALACWYGERAQRQLWVRVGGQDSRGDQEAMAPKPNRLDIRPGAWGWGRAW